jgi:dienelactone hydrolase
MKHNCLARVAAFSAGVVLAFSTYAAAQTAPPMGGGYSNVISIPVNDPSVKAIAGVLFKPTGVGPFPAIVYMSGCGGLNNNPSEMSQEKAVIDEMASKGIATLIVDPFTARGEMEGLCAKLNADTFVQYGTRGGSDALAAVNLLRTMSDIDPNRIFLQGYSWGAISSLFAVDAASPTSHDAKVAGLVAYYPYCWDKVGPTVPTLIMIGEKDDWTPAALCQKVQGQQNVEVVVYPGDFHGFTMPMDQPIDYLGHHIVYDEKSTKDAQARADAFLAAHMGVNAAKQ